MLRMMVRRSRLVVFDCSTIKLLNWRRAEEESGRRERKKKAEEESGKRERKKKAEEESGRRKRKKKAEDESGRREKRRKTQERTHHRRRSVFWTVYPVQVCKCTQVGLPSYDFMQIAGDALVASVFAQRQHGFKAVVVDKRRRVVVGQFDQQGHRQHHGLHKRRRR